MRKVGRPSPTFTNVEYKKSKGSEAIKLYKSTGQALLKWQEIQIRGIMAVDGSLWKYMKYGLAVGRRNGKGEILAAREFYGILKADEKICHTAHRTTTSHDAFNRLYTLLKKAGYEEFSKKKNEMPEMGFYASKQYGLERIEIPGHGLIDFRTRTNSGGLGEGFDVLVIDEAQEYTAKQESALAYTVSAAKNPQIILTGTPPTATSGGDVFPKLRSSVIDGTAQETGWAEWSIQQQTTDISNPALWYEYNPSMGYLLTERNVRAELTTGEVDFNVQRLGLWLAYSQKSAISAAEWQQLQVPVCPPLTTKRFFGVKFTREKVALGVAAKTTDGRIYVEAVEVAPIRNGDGWLLEYLSNPNAAKIAVDGESGRQMLVDDMAMRHIKRPVEMTVKQVIAANASFETGLSGKLVHCGQSMLSTVASNCEKRPIGSNGGFGYNSLTSDVDIAVLDCVIIAYWLAATSKDRSPQSISY